MTGAFGTAVTVEPPTVKTTPAGEFDDGATAADAGVANGTTVLPTFTPDGSKLTGTPETVTGGAPG